MTLRLRISARAAAEIERADAWRRENRLSVPGALREDLKAAFQLLLRQPGVGVKVTGARVSGARRLHLGRIRYFVYYRVKNEELAVLSVWHSSRARGPRWLTLKPSRERRLADASRLARLDRPHARREWRATYR